MSIREFAYVYQTSIVIAERLCAQLLAGPPAPTAVAVAERLLAVQAQDLRGARLAVRARTSSLHAADVDRALSEDRSLVVSWLNRGTLHLVRAEDYWWLHELTTPPVSAANARRLAQEGVSAQAADKGVDVIERSLLAEGRLTRKQLADRIAAAGVPVGGQAIVHLLMLAGLRGLIVRGPLMGAQHAYVLVREWLAPRPPLPDRDDALAQLARRYLRGHAPATERDLAKWAGLPLRDTRRAFALIADGLEQGEEGLTRLRRREQAHPLAPARLLGAYEPLLLGWTSREPFLPAPVASLVTSNGLFRPFALVAGQAVATWTLRPRGVDITPFSAVSAGDLAALEKDGADVVRFLASSS